MTSGKQISPPSLALKMQIANFIMYKFPKQERWKKYPHENNTNWGTEVSENFSKARLTGEFW